MSKATFDERGRIVLIDTLHIMSYDSGACAAQAKGILVGVVGAMVAFGMNCQDAIALCSKLAPKLIVPESVPEAWQNDMRINGVVAVGHRTAWQRSEGHR